MNHIQTGMITLFSRYLGLYKHTEALILNDQFDGLGHLDMILAFSHWVFLGSVLLLGDTAPLVSGILFMKGLWVDGNWWQSPHFLKLFCGSSFLAWSSCLLSLKHCSSENLLCQLWGYFFKASAPSCHLATQLLPSPSYLVPNLKFGIGLHRLPVPQPLATCVLVGLPWETHKPAICLKSWSKLNCLPTLCGSMQFCFLHRSPTSNPIPMSRMEPIAGQ